jgi:hypothetical protein
LPESITSPEVIDDSSFDIFSQLSFNYQASRIYGKSFKKAAEEKESIEPKKRRFYGIPEMEVFLDDYIKLPVMQEVFFELLPGIILRSRRSGYDIRIVNPLTGLFYDESPLVMIDGVILNDLNILADFDPELVEKIEVVKTPYLTGDLVLRGIVNVITRAGDFSNVTLPDYAVEFPYRVVEKPPSFNAPDYGDPEILSNRSPDLRNTLYWNPSVKKRVNGEAEIVFCTSDLPGVYSVNFQGITTTGEKIFLTKKITVL